MNVAHLGDCMEAMSKMKDNQFDLAIVDPPYGIGASKQSKSTSKIKGRKDSYVSRGTLDSKIWDMEVPPKEYFIELFRVSNNQIIWGGNYFTSHLIESNAWLIWDKCQSLETRSDGEMAWTSFKKPLKILPLIQDGFKRGKNIGRDSEVIYNKPYSGKQTIHPTQKPVALYKWLLKNYAKEGDTILDTHLGSGSSRIACYDMGFDFTGYEIDKDYHEAQELRFKQHTQQTTMFNPKDMYT